jgi:hypothetical protein
MFVAEKKGDYTTFESSFITTKSKTVLDEEEIEKICSEIHDLEAVYSVKTYDELQEVLNEHFFVGEEKEERKTLKQAKKEAVEDEDKDEIPMKHEEKKPAAKPKKVEKQEDDDIDELLAGLDD